MREALAPLVGDFARSLMWAITAFELALQAAVPLLYPLIRAGTIDPAIAHGLYESASLCHLALWPWVTLFLACSGFEELFGEPDRAW